MIFPEAVTKIKAVLATITGVEDVIDSTDLDTIDSNVTENSFPLVALDVFNEQEKQLANDFITGFPDIRVKCFFVINEATGYYATLASYATLIDEIFGKVKKAGFEVSGGGAISFSPTLMIGIKCVSASAVFQYNS